MKIVHPTTCLRSLRPSNYQLQHSSFSVIDKRLLKSPLRRDSKKYSQQAPPVAHNPGPRRSREREKVSAKAPDDGWAMNQCDEVQPWFAESGIVMKCASR